MTLPEKRPSFFQHHPPIMAPQYSNNMVIEQQVKDLLKQLFQLFQLGDCVYSYTLDTPLLGALPELDSMGVANLITALEEQMALIIDDDEIVAENFATLGSLVAFVAGKQ